MGLEFDRWPLDATHQMTRIAQSLAANESLHEAERRHLIDVVQILGIDLVRADHVVFIDHVLREAGLTVVPSPPPNLSMTSPPAQAGDAPDASAQARRDRLARITGQMARVKQRFAAIDAERERIEAKAQELTARLVANSAEFANIRQPLATQGRASAEQRVATIKSERHRIKAEVTELVARRDAMVADFANICQLWAEQRGAIADDLLNELGQRPPGRPPED